MAQKTAIVPTREENFSEWYQQVIKASDLAENSPVRGCMIMKPNGYAIWERIQQTLDPLFKGVGVKNAYFPLLIPLSFLEKEAEHVEGFAKECAVVTHHRLKQDDSDVKGHLVPTGKLEEPLVIRPTSETIIGDALSRWVVSYRDLPIKLNQWANVLRWEMRTRLFLRTAEFLWQEGHTAFATEREAEENTLEMLHLYRNFLKDYLAMPVILGKKTPDERFPGAIETYAMEAVMQDKKALQAGTTHFLGQNFSKSANIKYLDADGQEKFAWTTSWGVSTRLIGGLIMMHSDDDGLVLPPRIAPVQIQILPILKNGEDNSEILNFAQDLKQRLSKIPHYERSIAVDIDAREHVRGGNKYWQAVKNGIPVRVEIGMKELENNELTVSRRDQSAKDRKKYHVDEFIKNAAKILDDIQQNLYERAKGFQEEVVQPLNSRDEFVKYFKKKQAGLGGCYFSIEDEPSIADLLSQLKISARCIPLDQDEKEGVCIFTGKKVNTQVIFGRAY